MGFVQTMHGPSIAIAHTLTAQLVGLAQIEHGADRVAVSVLGRYGLEIVAPEQRTMRLHAV